MTDVRLVDVSLRDGNQSLWGAIGVRTRLVERVLPWLDRVGYHSIELMTSTLMATAVRFHREDPWQRIDAARRAAPHTPFGFLSSGTRFITFYRTPANLLELAYRLLRRHGIVRMWVMDPNLNAEAQMQTARMARRAGFDEVVGGICYTRSPIHTDRYFADFAAQIDSCEAIDTLYLKDPAGLLTPHALETLVPCIRSKLKRLQLTEIHTHCNTGLAPLTLLKAADLGIGTLHCALPPLANGSSHSPAQQLVANLRARGHTVNVDVDAMESASEVLRREAARRRLPAGMPHDYDEAYYRHTVPGGVLSTTRRQLAEMGRADLLPAVIEETVQVRSDLGWPIVVTPFSQYIVAQAALNVISGERYGRITDEVLGMLLGDWGPAPGPMNQDLVDRARSSARVRNGAREAEAPSLDELRARFGRGLSDEDLLLRALMPADQVDAMVRERGHSGDASLRELARLLEDPDRPLTVSVSQGGAVFTLSGGPHGRAAA